MRKPNSMQPSEPAWIEVSLTVDGELAEAVAEVLARFVPNGVAIQATKILPVVDGEGIGIGPLKVCGYLPVNEALEETRHRLEESLWFLGRIRPLPEAVFTPIQQVNWAESWKEHYQPILIGERLVVLPAWIEEVPPGRMPVRIEPGMAFGTGTHPTTQLCLEILERYVKTGEPVIDVGCGSGILSITALKLGASKALGVDIDPEALDSARENARLNEIKDGLEIGLGSAAEILAGDFTFQQAPVVLANILAPVIVRLLEDHLAKVVTPGGVLVLSGILEDQLEGKDGHVSVLEALRKHNMQILEIQRIQDWVALVVRVNKS